MHLELLELSVANRYRSSIRLIQMKNQNIRPNGSEVGYVKFSFCPIWRSKKLAIQNQASGINTWSHQELPAL